VGSHFDVGAKRFAELLEQKTNGQLRVEIFPGGMLGSETEVIHKVQTGMIELTFIGHDPLAEFAPVTTLLSMPYLFRDHDHGFRVLEGPVGEEIERTLRERQLRVLGWGNNGARVYTNNRGPIETPEDVRGLKVRSPRSPVNLAITAALGGIPVAMPFGETYTALQQGVVDGQENAVINVYPINIHEVQRYMSMTHHLLSFTVLVINENFFNTLSPELQEAVLSAAQEAMAFHREYVAELTDDLIARLQERGMQVNWPELEAFRAATQHIHEEYIGRNFSRELYQLVLDAE
jgi:tripartite ATP-independent transporter DctP family solute receptor